MEPRSDIQHSLEIAPVRCEFSSGVTEFRFLAHNLAETHAQLRITLFFGAFFYLAFSLTDIAALGYGHDALVLFLGRLTVAATAVACIVLTRHQRHSVAAARLAATVVSVVGLSTFMLVVVYRPQELPWHAMSMAIMLIVVYIFVPNRLQYSLAIALTATGVFLLVALAEGSLKPSDMVTMAMLLLLANTFGSLAARRYHRLWRQQFRTQSILKNLTVRDHLTGCFNRRYLHEKWLDSEVSRAQRYQSCLSVVMCDLDHFKIINDRYGHHGGDIVLRAFSDLLKTKTREEVDSVVRYGGEEFLLVLPETDLHGGVLLAERLRVAFAQATLFGEVDHKISTTASFGVATFDFANSKKSITLEDLIAGADKLLYEAKMGGRNQVRSMQLS